MKKPTDDLTPQEKEFLDRMYQRQASSAMQPAPLLKAGLEFMLGVRRLVWTDIERGDLEMAKGLEKRHLHPDMWLTTRLDEIQGGEHGQ